MEEFVAVDSSARCGRCIPTLLDNPTTRRSINQRHFDRLNGYLEEAKQTRRAGRRGQSGRTRTSASSRTTRFRRRSILDAGRRSEGHAGRDLRPDPAGEDATATWTRRSTTSTHKPRPLGLYYFGADAREEQQRALAHDVGRGHGQRRGDARRAGGPAVRRRRPVGHGRVSRPRRLPHLQPCAKAVFTQTRRSTSRRLAGLRPPYGEKIEKLLKTQIGK